MNEFIDEYQSIIAWFVYIGSGLIFSLFWWRMTRLVAHRGWRELLRGLSLVVIYTPWFTSEAHEHLAPATVVVLLDLMLGTSDNGLAGALVLLLVTSGMLVALIGRRFLLTSSHQEG
ncbi:MAG: hypothetical protein HOI67_07800 [Gammaproteobacteria bacterium]|nr:hypothetical protein [Gammaproteobacteria bacterium]